MLLFRSHASAPQLIPIASTMPLKITYLKVAPALNITCSNGKTVQLCLTACFQHPWWGIRQNKSHLVTVETFAFNVLHQFKRPGPFQKYKHSQNYALYVPMYRHRRVCSWS